MFETKIIRAEIPAGKRILVASDMHGHGHYLRKLLEKVDFCGDDILIIDGDMLEKGPDSLGTLRYAIELSARGNVHVLMGNVDAFSVGLIRKLSADNAEDYFQHISHWKNWWNSTLYHEMAAELGYELNCTEDVLNCKAEIESHFTKELAFVENLPTILETQNFVFVHGGLREKEVSDNQKWDMFSLTKYDDFINSTAHIFGKYVVVGHWPVTLYCGKIPSFDPIIDREKHIISIDGGCGIKEDGQLNLLIIPDISCGVDDITFQSYDELPTVTALEDQEASEDSLSITWSTRKIEILEKGEEFTKIRHVLSEKVLDIPTAYLYHDDECRDYTDYRLPVKAGDKLSVTHKTSRGIIAKHGGAIGWYEGRYE